MISQSLLQEIHEKYYGAQDKAIDAILSLKPDTLEIDETRTPITKIITLDKNCIDLWPDGREAGKRYAITNIKVINYHDIEIGDAFELQIGGQRFHKMFIICKEDIQPDLFSFFHYQDLIPGLIYHNLRINYNNYNDDKKKEFRIEYTLVPIKEFREGFNQIVLNTQFTGLDTCNPVRLQFNHPVYELNVYTEKEVLEGYLDIDGVYKLPLTKVSENHWRITFQELVENRFLENRTTLNFTRIYDSYIGFSENPDGISVVANTIHVYRIYNDMAGLAFTK